MEPKPTAGRRYVAVSPLGNVAEGAELELAAYISEVPAGNESGRHRHSYSTLVHVLEGSFRLEIGEHAEKSTDYKAGDFFNEPAGVVVNGRALTATKLLVVLPRQRGKPESIAAV